MPSEQTLIDAARAARGNAYAPYSNFAVGAAIATEDGRVFCGCNVENISFGLTCCAERNALFAAVAAGVKTVVSIAIVADSVEPVTPCGACRQVLAEFAPKLEIVCTNLQGDIYRSTLDIMLPRPTAGILGS